MFDIFRQIVLNIVRGVWIMEKVTNEVKEDKKDKKQFSIVKTIWNFVFWICLIGLAIIWLFDFTNTRNGKDPKFCLSKSVINYYDGTVDKCTGLGYKVYNYHRSSLNAAREFVPFWVEPREK
jgi:hypothetical protein